MVFFLFFLKKVRIVLGTQKKSLVTYFWVSTQYLGNNGLEKWMVAAKIVFTSLYMFCLKNSTWQPFIKQHYYKYTDKGITIL